MTTPEQEKPVVAPPEVQEIPETPQISQTSAQAGVTVTPTQVVQPVQPTSTTSSIQSGDDALVLPKSEEELEKESKGSSEESRTWWAATVIRMLKKAIHFGKKIVGLQPKQ